MAEVVLFHHAQGQTPGFLPFADELRAAGHTVHAPDLYDGQTFATLDEGVRYAQQVGFGTIGERGRRAAESLPNDVVYAGFSLGGMPAQMLAQTRPGAEGALLFSAAFPPSEFDALAAGRPAADPHDGGRQVRAGRRSRRRPRARRNGRGSEAVPVSRQSAPVR